MITIVDEKHMDTKHSAEELAKNLARHEIDIVLDRVEAKASRLVASSNRIPWPTRWICL